MLKRSLSMFVFHQVTQPVLVLVGELAVPNFLQAAKELPELVPNCRIVILEGETHRTALTACLPCGRAPKCARWPATCISVVNTPGCDSSFILTARQLLDEAIEILSHNPFVPEDRMERLRDLRARAASLSQK